MLWKFSHDCLSYQSWTALLLKDVFYLHPFFWERELVQHVSLANVEMPQMLLNVTHLPFYILRVLPALRGLAQLFYGKENISPTNLDKIQCLGGKDCETFCEASADGTNKRRVSVPMCLLWEHDFAVELNYFCWTSVWV